MLGTWEKQLNVSVDRLHTMTRLLLIHNSHVICVHPPYSCTNDSRVFINLYNFASGINGMHFTCLLSWSCVNRRCKHRAKTVFTSKNVFMQMRPERFLNSVGEVCDMICVCECLCCCLVNALCLWEGGGASSPTRWRGRCWHLWGSGTGRKWIAVCSQWPMCRRQSEHLSRGNGEDAQ